MPDWNAVYREAAVHPPPHGYGVDRVSEMLETKRFGSLDRDTKRKAILAALDAAAVSIRDVIQDAVLRDEALQAFESVKQREVEELRVRTEGRIQTIQQELETVLRDSNAELERLKRGTEESARSFTQFQERKRAEESRLRQLLSHFVRDEENPIPGRTGGGPVAADLRPPADGRVPAPRGVRDRSKFTRRDSNSSQKIVPRRAGLHAERAQAREVHPLRSLSSPVSARHGAAVDPQLERPVAGVRGRSTRCPVHLHHVRVVGDRRRNRCRPGALSSSRARPMSAYGAALPAQHDRRTGAAWAPPRSR